MNETVESLRVKMETALSGSVAKVQALQRELEQEQLQNERLAARFEALVSCDAHSV